MTSASLDPSAIVQRALEYATTNLRIERLLIQLGLDPSNVTYEAVFARLFDILLVNITFANLLALIGGIAVACLHQDFPKILGLTGLFLLLPRDGHLQLLDEAGGGIGGGRSGRSVRDQSARQRGHR